MEESNIVDEIKCLESKFINEKINLIRKFVNSKTEYWQQIPKLYLIYGKNDERSDLIVKNKIYPVDNYFFDSGSSFCCINCKNAEIVYYNKKLGDYVSIEVNESVKKSIAFSVNCFMLESIDGESICSKYTQINEKRNIEVGDEAVELWIMRSILSEIPITLDDFRTHFNNDFGYDDKTFTMLYNNCMAKLAGNLLSN